VGAGRDVLAANPRQLGIDLRASVTHLITARRFRYAAEQRPLAERQRDGHERVLMHTISLGAGGAQHDVYSLLRASSCTALRDDAASNHRTDAPASPTGHVLIFAHLV
jgi:hypothetical protein